MALCLTFGQTTAQSWSASIAGVGTFSSPRCTDLNQDGVLDIVMGAGREEFMKCDSAVLALDGKTGKMLWHVRAIDQIFGSAIFMDITGDSVQDVFIGGRSAELLAIDGAEGRIIWRFCQVNNILETQKEGWFNFYNPQFIADQDGDQLPDMIISNGGDVMAEPHDSNRPPGHLTIISAKTGLLLSKAAMPDQKEI
ncbi:MAG: PQQ-binding-like beta-propeller repeat protein, partial [Saprospiraceae bacterium]|nr:PQQ-binding-like beta-propeller repeat protein [Saprospiraceae bacterium]